MTDDERERFDALLEEVIESLPRGIGRLLDEISVVVLDEPTEKMARELEEEGVIAEGEAGELCGLHTGTALTERSVDDQARLPDQIHLFRRGIIATAGGWDQPDADDAVYEEIGVTLLHEIGHHFGLDEDDLAELGYD